MRNRLLQLIFAIFVVISVGVIAWKFFARSSRGILDTAIGRSEQQIDLGAVVTKIRELNRLETASMRVMHVSTVRQSYGVVPDALSGDTLTFMAVGDVIAGVDLSKLDPAQVRRGADGTIVMRLPPAEVLVTRIDNNASRVINRETGLLRRQDVQLESRARSFAESGVRREALKKNILSLASRNAETKLAELMHTVGFQQVRFEQSAPVDSRAN